MAKIFNNINKALYPSERGLNLSGWEKTTAYDTSRIPHITDTVGSGIALSKMGTSIPTPFARVFLFKTAFEMVNGSPEGANDNSAYGKLVSECLDFLEFIYGYGDAIEVKPWNVSANIAALKTSPSEGHQVLGKSLENFALNLDVKDIYLIYYNGELIGGTSPFTLVYTLPNWQREKNITDACGLAGNQLFPDYSEPTVDAVPLYKRHIDFRTMLTRYFVAFRNVAGMKNTAFFEYIYRNQQIHDKDMKTLFQSITGAEPYDAAKFRADYGCVKANMSEIDVLGKGGVNTLFLATKAGIVPPVPGGGGTNTGGEGIDISQIAPDYMIAATVDNGNVVTPLVLSDAGITGATYVAGMPWTVGVDIPRDADEPLSDRILPGGMNIKYPYLTDADFLQEKIIKVGYKVDTDNFMTFGISTSGDGDYLLPLRKEIFEYFTPSDFVDGNVEGLAIRLEEESKETLKVHLFIPVKFKGHPYIELVHTYYKEDIVEMKSLPNLFSVGVFPSYKISDSNIPNVYSVMILDIKNKVTTKYYALINGGVTDVEVTASKNRMKNGSRYEEINHAFDICEVEVDGAKALLLPNFKEVTPDGGTNVVVGIDFGTTNTYVCYSTKDGADPHSLEISRDDMQVLMLNKIDLSKGNYGEAYKKSMNMMPSYIQSIDREFVPLLLGRESDVAYPFRTVVCETNEGKECFKNLANFQLFADINIGFNFLKEILQLPNEKYNTNIKWDIEKQLDDKDKKETPIRINRIRAYCQQTAWMIKNKLMLLHAPCSKFKVYLTFPYTMKRNVRSKITEYWNDAFDVVMGHGNVEVKKVTESIAPYYTMVSNGGNFTKNALNIDIGGGTTDMLFADIENNKFYYTSSKFAGNDIWGDGKQKVEKVLKNNGFVLDFESKLNGNAIKVPQDGEDNPKTAYFQYKNIVENSADLMSYVFRYEDKYRYTDFIRQSNKKFLPILCIHLGAILYHVAQVLTEKEITIPSTITFSGMGAKYIHILSTEKEDVHDIVKVLLQTFMASMSEDGKCDMPSRLKVSFQENAKEVTAQGAMLVGHKSLQDISDYEEDSLCVYGVNEKVNHKLVYGEAPKYKNEVISNFENFLDMFLNNSKIINFFKEFDIEFTPKFIETIKNEAEKSFDLMAENGATDDISETMFFWPLKNGLYEASKL